MSAPAELAALTREQLIDLCQWNDRNGCYSDSQCIAEFGEIGTTEGLREIVAGWIAEDPAVDVIAMWRAARPAQAVKIMTFAEFQATGRDVGDFSTIAECDGWEGGGRVYADGYLVIEKGASAAWCLTIGNSSRESDDLVELERELYEFGVSEGLLS